MNNLLKIILLISPFFSINSYADVVKPALIEISVYDNATYIIEIRASVEALLTGINSQYKNTKDAPGSQNYDKLRVLSSEQLRQEFIPFQQTFINTIRLKLDGKLTQIQFKKVDIPLPGYTKVPRTSLITLTGSIPRATQTLSWFYPQTFGDNAVRVRQVDKKNEKWHWSSWQWLKDNQESTDFSLNEVFTQLTLIEIFKIYSISGFEHILPKGLDHILFILGLFLFSIHFKPLLWQVTMFTVAHTMTLGLAMNDLITVPASIVEPLIALSISYIAFENIAHNKEKVNKLVSKGLQKSRLFIVFFFGLLHGLGFASVLNDFGMPKDDFLSALISFNIGVELGQLSIIMTAYIIIAYWFKNKPWYNNFVIIPASLAISLIGLFWTYKRFDSVAIIGALNEVFS